MADDLIAIDRLVKRYGPVNALAGVTLRVAQGEFLALLGPSGCGKTTLLRCIAGFVDPTEGDVRIGGKLMNDVPPHERPVNTVFQNYALFPHLTVSENVGFGPRRKGVAKAEIAKQVEDVLTMVGMEGFGDRMPRQLSGGQQQRIALARAIVNRPQVLLLDEPLGALDLKLRKRMQVELKRLHEKLGMTFVYVTHDQEEALVMADRIAVMNHGEFVQIGTGEEIYRAPNSRYVADFIGEANLIDCAVRSGRLDLAGAAALPYDAPAGAGTAAATLMVRPEDIQVGHPGGGADAVALQATVRDKVFVGSSWRVYATLGSGQEIAAQPGFSPELERARPGETIQLWWPRERGRVLSQ
ncbi:MAG: ABC transporter ATP-binding protein [Alphaproteobacteria bacterium]